jgi:hypothetical protein
MALIARGKSCDFRAGHLKKTQKACVLFLILLPCGGMETKLSHRGRIVTDADIVFIRNLITEHPTASRRALSKKLCAAWNWVQPNGALRDMVCRGLMLELHRAGHIELPPVRWAIKNPLARRTAQRKKPTPWLVDTTPLRTSLDQVRPLEFHQVRRTWEEPLFNYLLEGYHYLHYTQPVGPVTFCYTSLSI